MTAVPAAGQAVAQAAADPAAPLLPWATDALAQALAPIWPGLAVQAVAHIGSTNTELLARARHTHPSERDALPCLLVAEAQTAGRGRQGKTWHAAAGSSLTFSLALPLCPASWSGLSLAVGLALADAIDPPGSPHPSLHPGPTADGRPSAMDGATDGAGAAEAPRLGLKWPNDLLMRNSAGTWCKVGGILIETLPYEAPGRDGRSPAGQRLAVIGIGLNLQPPPLVPGGDWGIGGLQALHPGLTAPALLAQVAAPLLQAVKRFEQQGFAPLVAGYARRDLLRGQAVVTTLPQAPEGVADGVDAQGLLWLRQGASRQALGSGEVSLRPAPTTSTAAPGTAPC